MHEKYGNIDAECVTLCDSINKMKGLKTTYSCCGHGKQPFYIFIAPEHHDNLSPLVFILNKMRQWYPFRWHIEIVTRTEDSPLAFRLTSAEVGEKAYEEANLLSGIIEKYLQPTGLDPEFDQQWNIYTKPLQAEYRTPLHPVLDERIIDEMLAALAGLANQDQYSHSADMLRLAAKELKSHYDNPKNDNLKVYAWYGVDEFGSEVGLKQARVPAGMIPLVAMQEHKINVPIIIQQLQDQSSIYNRNIKLGKFVLVEDIVELKP